MIPHARSGLSACALIALMLAGRSAFAGSTATRCEARGCVHIHCNSTGDRCYRYEGYADRAGHSDCKACRDEGPDGGYRVRAEPGAHLLCDSDGDRCYTSYARRWNYRDYYRHRGYRWDD